MSKTIDERVVQMQFDNRQFEQNVKTSMSTIDKLKKSLNFTGAAKSLESVDTAAKKVNMSGLSSAVDAVQVKFSSLQVIAVTALSNITNSAINAGKRIVSALTIDPITTGFQEYETQINAVQTILANTQSKGSTLTDVNKALDELNKYADMTIYNFTEMTRNIGTFTAAGVDLERSVSSIKGIANLAAVSGSTAQQASTAMYQLSQALAAGKVSLMDWNSVVNAGMGGEVFQTALKRTAEHFGYNVDAMIQKYGSFRESLTEGGWLTAEVLTETLTQLSGAYSEADLIAQGYSAEQAKEIAELAQTAVDAATKVKTFTQLWDTLKEAAQSGWTETWEILIGDFEEAKELLTWMSDTFGEIIGQSADARNALLYDGLTSNWKKLTDQIADAGINVEEYKDKVIELATKAGVPIDDLITEYGSLEKAFKNGAIESKYLDDALTAMTGTTEELNKKLSDLEGTYKSNNDILKALRDAGYEEAEINELVSKSLNGEQIALNDLSDAQLMSIGYTAEQVEEIRTLSKHLELAGGSVKEFTDNIAAPSGRENLIAALQTSIKSLISIFGEAKKAWDDVFPQMSSDRLYEITESIKDFASSLQPSTETLDKLSRTFKGLFSILSIGKQAVTAIIKPFGSLFGSFGEISGGLLDITANLGDYIYGLDQSMKAGEGFSGLTKIISDALTGLSSGVSIAIGCFGNFTDVLSGIASFISKVFTVSINAIGSAFTWLRENIGAGDIFAGLAGGGIFVFLKKLGGVIGKVKDILDGFFGDGGGTSKFSEVLDSIHGSLEAFQQGLQVASLVGIAAAVMLLSSSLRKISEIEPAKIAYSLVAIRLMIASLNSGFSALTQTLSKFNVKGVLRASIAMIAIAEAVNLLADAMQQIGSLSLAEIAKGLLGIGVGIKALTLAIRSITGKNITLRTSVALLALAQACKMLSEAMSGFAALSWGEIARGLTAMAGALAELTIVAGVLSKISGFGSVLGATSILIMVQSLDEISENLKKLGALSWGEIGRGLSAMGGALTEFTISLSVLSKIGGFGAILGGTAILIAAQSLDEIAMALKDLGSMSWGEIGRGLSAMGGALIELSAVSGLLGKLGGFSGLLGAGTLVLGVQSLRKLSDALAKFGDMSWDEIARGLVGMGGALIELAGISGTLGALTNVFGLLGAGSLLLGIQGLGDLADALAKFGDMSWDEIGRGLTAMGGALGEVALGGLLNTFSGLGASSIQKLAGCLGDLADSVKRWTGVKVPDGLGKQLGELASGVAKFTFDGWGAEALATVARPIGTLADSIMKWSGVSIPSDLGAQIGSLAGGISVFTFSGWGADALATVAPAIGDLADSLKKWGDVSVPDGIGEDLESIANGVKAFTLAFVGGWSIGTIIDPLSALPDAIKKWKNVSVPKDLEEELTSLANGVKAFSFAFMAGWSLDTVVGPLGDLATSISKWKDVSVPDNLDEDLTSLADGVKAFTWAFMGGFSMAAVTGPMGELADSIKKWEKVTVPSNIGEDLNKLADGVKSFSFAFVGGWSIGEVSGPLGNLAGSIKKWNGVSIPANLGEQISSLSSGVKSFNFADWGADTLGTVSTNLGLLADSISKLSATDVSSIGSQLTALSVGVSDMVNSGLTPGFTTTLSKFLNVFAGENVSSATSNIRTLVTAFNNMSSLNLGGLSTFQSALDNLGKISIDGLVSSLQNGAASVTTAIDSISYTMQTSFSRAAFTVSPIARNVGTTIAKDISNGVKVGLANLSLDTSEALTNQASSISARNGAFKTAGETLANSMVSGFNAKFSTFSSDISSSLSTISTTLSNQSYTFQSIGVSMMNWLITGVKSKASDLSGAFNTMVDTIVSSLRNKQNLFNSVGQALMTNFISGVKAKEGAVKTSFASLLNLGLTEIKNKYKSFMTAGQTIITSMISGISEKSPTLTVAFDTPISKMLSSVRNSYQSFKSAGAYLVQGFADGISANTFLAESRAAAMANASYNSAMRALDAHSPSRLFMKVGSYVSLGFARGIEDETGAVEDSSAYMANAAIENTKKTLSKIVDSINNGIDSQPTIRPVLDLSDIETKTHRLNTLFTSQRAMKIGASMNPGSFTVNDQNGATDAKSPMSVSFTQYNTSPKALSRIEIYRQTKNLFSTLERTVTT